MGNHPELRLAVIIMKPTKGSLGFVGNGFHGGHRCKAEADTRHHFYSDASSSLIHSFIKISLLLINRLALSLRQKFVASRHNNKIKSSCESTVRHHRRSLF